jgi:hypothetical protein
MRALPVAITLIWALGTARAQPIGVRIECEEPGRTKVCPAFLLGLVDAHEVLIQSPRATADVIVYANVTQVALVDRLHLRFVSKLPGTPPVVELDVDLDSRADDDTQRAQLEPAFLQGIALYVVSRYPKLVTVAIAAPDGDEIKTSTTSPLDLALDLTAFGNWTGKYQNYNGSLQVSLTHTTIMRKWGFDVWSGGGVNRQPPLMLDDGTLVSVNNRNYNYGAATDIAQLLSQRYSIGAQTSAWRDDPKGQYRYGWTAKLGIEWDRFRSDDPRGNRLAVLYAAGYQVDGYNLRNVLGERFAHYPIHMLAANGSFRKDKVSIGLFLSVNGEILHPTRRHQLSASPSLDVQLGARVDLGLSFSITKRALPVPDERYIDPDDYAQLTRLSYAEPLTMSGALTLKLHWDRTNGERNDRLSDL